MRIYSGSAWENVAVSTSGFATLAGVETLTNKTLTSPKINEDVAVTSTATELNLLDGVSGLVQADFTKLAAIDASAAEIDTLDALSRGSIIYGNASAATTVLTKGTANQVLTSDGTDISWSDAAGGTDWQSSIVTGTTLTAVAGRGYWINTTSNACTITLPASASVGDELIFVDYARTWGTNAITINQNSLNFQGNTSPNPVYNTNGQSVNIIYSGATNGWIPNSDDDVTYETPQTADVEYLVVGGGGAGGAYYGGGGGAGGYLTATLSSVTVGVTLTATVGGGGASVSFSAPNGVEGNDGINSSLSGTGFSTVTSVGGGGGGAYSTGTGNDGGSGGGGSSTGNSSGGSGTSPQGNDGGDAISTAPDFGSAGGGGAGAVGGNANNVAGDGGAGTASSITGSSVTYAGGGGGSSEESATKGSGGTGGGGAGGDGRGTDGVSGTANTGGGGGGANQTENSGAGGSGVIILKVLTADYSGTSTGSPTVTTSGSHTIIKFTGSGTYTI